MRDYTVVVTTQVRKTYRVEARSRQEAAFGVHGLEPVSVIEQVTSIHSSPTLTPEQVEQLAGGERELDVSDTNSGEPDIGGPEQVRSIEDAGRRRQSKS